ncbi:MAG TPA: toprim domain-containing protein, partial [Caldithrix sp.]|nr:toprim domain-containing protein [Caldithrix sp.]
IYNLSGRVIAFGGRTLSSDPNTPKYVNSPESPIYNKSEVLFGLHSSKEWIRQEGFAIFVEGYMDFLQLWQNGIKNVVATSGTSLTENHAKLIRRYTGEVTLCYDSDSAGIKAAERGGQILFQNNLEVKVLILPAGEDPDSFVRSHGPSEFHSLVETAQSFYDFKLEYLLKTIGSDTVSRQSKVVSELLESLAAHPDMIKVNFFVNKIARKFGLQEQALMAELQKKRRIYHTRQQRLQERQTKETAEPGTSMFLTGAWSAEKDVIVLLLNHFEKMKDVIFEVLRDEEFSNENLRSVFCYIRDHQDQSAKDLTHLVLVETTDEQIVSMLTADLFKEIENPAQYLNDCIYRIKIAYVQSQINTLREQLKEAKTDTEEYKILIKEINSRLAQKQKLQKVFSQD